MRDRNLRRRYKNVREFAGMLAALALILSIGLIGLKIKCVTLAQDNAELERTMTVVERQNAEYQQYINEVNLKGGMQND